MKHLVLWLTLLCSARALAMDLVTQDVEVDLASTPDRLSVSLRLEVRLTATETNLELLAPTGTIDAASIDGLPAAVSADSFILVVTPTAPLAAGLHTLQLHVDGVPACASSRGRQCSRTAAFTFLPALSEQVRWYAAGTGFVTGEGLDPFVGTVKVRAPASHLVAMVQGATPVRTTNADGTQTWAFPYATPTESLGLVAGALTAFTSSDGFVTGYTMGAETRPMMEQFVTDAARFYPVFTELYGPLPLSHFSITFVPADFVAGAMGQFGLIFASETLAMPQFSYISAQFAHEVAHSWWGNFASPQAPFLSEGMAEYSLWRAREVLDGADVARSGRRMNATWYQYGRGSVGDVAILNGSVSSSQAYVFVTYHKGAVVLRGLEELIGTEALTRGLKSAVQSNPDLSVDAWLAAIQAQTPVDLAPWRRAWLDQPGFPMLTVESAVVAGADGQRVSLSITSSGDFPMKVPLRFRFSDGSTQRRSVLLAGRVSEFAETFGSAPVSIELDPDWTSVREVVPALIGDVTLDGLVDGADLLEVALHLGTAMPTTRRQDGRYDPLYDLDGDRLVGERDLDTIVLTVR